jgi:hypothetical protein
LGSVEGYASQATEPKPDPSRGRLLWIHLLWSISRLPGSSLEPWTGVSRASAPLCLLSGWVAWGPCHVRMGVLVLREQVEVCCGRCPRARGRRCHSYVRRAPASLLSRVSDAKNSLKEKPRKPCNVIPKTSQCKLSVTALNMRGLKKRSGGKGSNKHLQGPLQRMFTW